MKRILAFLLATFLFVSLAACGAEAPAVTQGTTEAPGWKLGGVALEEFTLVYGDEATFAGGLEICGKLEDVAIRFSDSLFALTGIRLEPVFEDDLEALPAHLIALGKIGAKELRDFYKAGDWEITDYSYGLFGGQLVLMGGSVNACYFAGEDFLAAFAQQMDFSAEPVSGSHALIRVACVGDSITEGHGTMDDGSENDRNLHTYPIYLQRLLGYEYYLANFGKGGARLTNYPQDPKYALSVKFAADWVIFMLGTNDCSPLNDQWGTEAYTELYKSTYKSMVEMYRSYNADVQMVVMTPPSIVPGAKQKEGCRVISGYIQEFSEEYGWPLVDLFTVSEQEAWKFNDGIHPQGEVYQRIAEVIYESIRDVMK